jgi:hemerythrin-like metal-binding protein
MIKWQDSYSVGNDELDEQHKDLFQFCNDLNGILQDRDVSKKMLEGCLEFLGKYVAVHFHREESCMHQYACPVAENNKSAHQKFIQAYDVFLNKFIKGDDSYLILTELHKFLQTWLVEHICKIDVKLKPCIHPQVQ